MSDSFPCASISGASLRFKSQTMSGPKTWPRRWKKSPSNALAWHRTHQVRVLEDVTEADGGIVSMTLLFHTFDLGAKLPQLFVEVFVAAIDMINPAHFSNAAGFETGEDERGRSAQIARHDGRA